MAVIQVTPVVRATGNPLTASLVFSNAITAGSTVAVALHQIGMSVRTHTATESGSSSGWSLLHTTASVTLGISKFLGRPNHPGGGTTVAVSNGNSSSAFAAFAIEFEAGPTIDLVATDEYADPSVTDFHRASNTGLTTSAAVLGLIAAGANNTLFTNGVPKSGSGWSKAGGTDDLYYFAYQEFPTGTTAQLGEWDSTGTDRIALSAMALLGTDTAAPTAQVIGGGWFGT